MILILSESSDITSTKVTEWLNYFDIPYLRLDDNLSIDIIDLVTLNNNKPEIKFTYKNKQYSFDDFSIIWNRRGDFQFSIPDTTKLQQNLNVNSIAFSKHLFEESKTLRDYIAHKISDKFHIDDYRKYNANKLITLDVATKVGLKIPETYITSVC